MAHPAISREVAPGVELRFPVVLRPPRRFDPARLETWPHVDGRLEFHEGQLRYMPPCADTQSLVVFSVVQLLGAWLRKHRQFVGGTNEAGMLLGGSVRAADGAVWRKDQLKGHVRGTLYRAPPVLAVEVAGADEDEQVLLDKARWYLDHGVTVVWLVLAERKQVLVCTTHETTRHSMGQHLPPHPALPGLAPSVRPFFEQLD